MARYGDAVIIHSFALLHAVAAVACRLAGIGDSTVLTVLTMAMTVILCLRGKLNVEISAISIILVNIVGYVVGLAAAAGLGLLFSSELLVPALSTFLTTELLGWVLVAFMRQFRHPEQESSDLNAIWLIAAVAAILAARLLIGGLFGLFVGQNLFGAFSTFVSNTVVLLTITSLTVLFIVWQKKWRGSRSMLFVAAGYTVFFAVSASLGALLVAYMDGKPLTGGLFWELAIIGLILEVAIFSLTYLIDYALSTRHAMERERDKANQAKSQYMNLKNQVNPHFLFNSLNILDYLVAEEKTLEARDYIRKLSGLYRYMLRNENEPLVPLSDELEYARMYTELIKIRFPEGLDIRYDIAEGDANRRVATFSVQMLLENAIKHNAVSSDKPLVISVSSDGEAVSVVNNLVPKLTPVESTGVGLDYIRQNYLGLGGRDIRIEKSEGAYKVSLPLL